MPWLLHGFGVFYQLNTPIVISKLVSSCLSFRRSLQMHVKPYWRTTCCIHNHLIMPKDIEGDGRWWDDTHPTLPSGPLFNNWFQLKFNHVWYRFSTLWSMLGDIAPNTAVFPNALMLMLDALDDKRPPVSLVARTWLVCVEFCCYIMVIFHHDSIFFFHNHHRQRESTPKLERVLDPLCLILLDPSTFRVTDLLVYADEYDARLVLYIFYKLNALVLSDHITFMNTIIGRPVNDVLLVRWFQCIVNTPLPRQSWTSHISIGSCQAPSSKTARYAYAWYSIDCLRNEVLNVCLGLWRWLENRFTWTWDWATQRLLGLVGISFSSICSRGHPWILWCRVCVCDISKCTMLRCISS